MSASEAELDLQKKISRLEGAVEALAAQRKENQSFFRDPSKVIALSAFIISMVTAVYGYLRETRQDEDALRNRLRTALTQSGDLAVKYQELRGKYGSDPALLELSQWLGVQNTMLAEQGFELVMSSE